MKLLFQIETRWQIYLFELWPHLLATGKALYPLRLIRLTKYITEALLHEFLRYFGKSRSTRKMIFTAQQIQKKHTEQNKNQHVSFIFLAETFDTIAHRTLARSLGQSPVFDVEVEAKQSCIPFSYFPALPQMLLPDYTPIILHYKECGTSNHYLRDSRVDMNHQGHIRITTCSPFGVWLCLAAVKSAETEGHQNFVSYDQN